MERQSDSTERQGQIQELVAVNRQYVSVAGCNCGCCGCGCGPAFRGFLTSQEQLERLKTCRDQLERELAGRRVQRGMNQIEMT